MPICSFSGKQIPPGTGIMYVQKDGKVLWFLNSKCEKNYVKLKRKPRFVTWTEEARHAKTAGQKPAGDKKTTAKTRLKTEASE